MKNAISSLKCVFSLIVAASALQVTLQADTIAYDNSTSYLANRYWAVDTQFGDEINLSTTTTDRLLKTFKFEYWLSHDVNSNETVTLFLYNNNGADYFGGTGNPTPGTVLYQSDAISIPNGQRTIIFDLSTNNITVPNRMTWAVQFGGVTGSEQVGLLMYNPPTVGSSLDDYWEKVGSTWTLKNFDSAHGGPVANFGAQVITVVPEPSTVLLGIVGAAVLGLAMRRRR
jgi:hypothetical protein